MIEVTNVLLMGYALIVFAVFGAAMCTWGISGGTGKPPREFMIWAVRIAVLWPFYLSHRGPPRY